MQSGKKLQGIMNSYSDIIKMSVDEFGRMPKAGEKITNEIGVSIGYLNNNFLRKGQAIGVNGKPISNLGSARGPPDAVRKKYVNKKFLRKGPIDINQKVIKTVLCPVDEGDAANESYVDSKSVGGNDLNIRGHSIKNVKCPEEAHDATNHAFVYFVENTKLAIAGGEMRGDLSRGGHRVTAMVNPQDNQDAVN